MRLLPTPRVESGEAPTVPVTIRLVTDSDIHSSLLQLILYHSKLECLSQLVTCLIFLGEAEALLGVL